MILTRPKSWQGLEDMEFSSIKNYGKNKKGGTV